MDREDVERLVVVEQQMIANEKALKLQYKQTREWQDRLEKIGYLREEDFKEYAQELRNWRQSTDEKLNESSGKSLGVRVTATVIFSMLALAVSMAALFF